jgi:glycosyltransferase involved in cell wall biosynthesis
MNLLVTSETRFVGTPDGAVWTEAINAYNFWKRYLSVFDGVKVLARVRPSAAPPRVGLRANGPGVAILCVPDYLGPWQYLVHAAGVHRALRAAFDPRDGVILRTSSHIAGCLEPALARIAHPYGMEVVSDPYEVYAPHAVRTSLRPLLRWWFTRQLRGQCKRAAGVAYVTEAALQQRYPCGSYSVGMSDVEITADTIVRGTDVFSTFYSSVELTPGDSATVCAKRPWNPKPVRLITVASLAQMYKAPDVLIRALALCVREGLDLTLRVVGDGRHRPELERLAAGLGVSGRVQFLGSLPAGAAVRTELDNSDLFVLPSRTEGLPRAMVEAMARSLPCIGTTVGGIPELLAAEDLVGPGDAAALAKKIREVVSSPARLLAMSERNLARAQDYRDEVLAKRRRAFFEHIRYSTAAWLSASAAKRGSRATESQLFENRV